MLREGTCENLVAFRCASKEPSAAKQPELEAVVVEVPVASAAWARLRLAAAGWLKHSESQLIRTQLASGSPPGLLSHPQATRLGLGPQHGAPTTCSSLLLAVCTPSLFWRCSTSSVPSGPASINRQNCTDQLGSGLVCRARH